MRVKDFEFNRMELAGSLGDIGTLLPLALALITITGLSFSSVFLMVGLFYIASGLYYRLPIPVQPLKVVAAIAIASPDRVTVPVIAATGIIFGGLLLLLGFSGIVDRLARLFSRPVVRGIQLGLGLILIVKGIDFIRERAPFINDLSDEVLVGTVPANLIIGLVGVVLVLLLLNSRRYPAALVLIVAGLLVAIPLGAFDGTEWALGYTRLDSYLPAAGDWATAVVFLVLPQIPLTIGNAIIGTADTARSLFGTGGITRRATHRAFSASMGLVNLAGGFIGAMPMCHGAGGLAAHYRFGARTGGSNIMIGCLFLISAVALGKVGITLFSAVPNGVLGVLLLFAGLELAVLIRDLENREEVFIAALIAGIGLATRNMGIAFGAGIAVSYLVRWVGVKL